MSFDPIPQARVVRHAGQLMAPPPAPRSEEPAGYLRTALVYAVGLWPLTCVMMLVAALLLLAFAIVGVATTVASLGGYCLTTDTSDVRRLPSQGGRHSSP